MTPNVSQTYFGILACTEFDSAVAKCIFHFYGMHGMMVFSVKYQNCKLACK